MQSSSLAALLACPACSGPLEQLVCSSCGARYRSPGGIPDLRLPSDSRTEVVREFYSAAPFPAYPARETLVNLRERGRRSEFARLLDEAIPPVARVLELGCGTGQLSLFLATADRMVIGADLARPSLELAVDAAKRRGSPGMRDGYLVLGLYNAFARLPHRLRRGIARLSGFRLIPFDPVLRERDSDSARRSAWLRDQYQHPE